MTQVFTLELSAEDKEYLLCLARKSVEKHLRKAASAGLSGQSQEAAPAVENREGLGEVLKKPLGAFVSLHENGTLRGCIGRLSGDAPLYLTVSRMAIAAAFHDARFPPVSPEELGRLHYEISVLGPITPCPDAEKIVIGRHGLIMKKGSRQGLLLPQVPVAWHWNREEFLRHTCNKANLPLEQWKEAWKEGSDTELYWFEAVVFAED
ncbi:MAG: AmmeMemoRadiSam system protein A [Deltaproteobacteria bacterium]|jgi:AmmeMemoRadiSam system protein A|nr:AmmeMemoRadiSam system protein A [Deltaproteobacteria bacterium]